MDEKILIIGSSGRLGCKFLTRMSAIDWDREKDGDLPKMSLRGVKKIKSARVIIHLAAKMGMFDKDCYQVNVLGTRKILELINKEKKVKFIFTSSIDVEKMPTDYAKSKLMAEKEIENYAKKNKNFDYLVLRLGNVDFRERLVALSKNKFLRRLFGQYKLNLVESDEVIQKIVNSLDKKHFGNKIVKFYGQRVSANDLSGKRGNDYCWVEKILVWLMRLTRRGGFYLYLTFQEK